MQTLVSVEEVLFVFNAWTLMLRSDGLELINKESKIVLLNKEKAEIGLATVGRILTSKNQNITPVELKLLINPNNIKETKYIRVIQSTAGI